VSISAAPNGDLHFNSLVHRPRWLVPMGDGVYRDKDGPDRVAFRPLNGRMALYDPYGDKAWERIGYFDSPAWDLLIVGLTLIAALATLVGAAVRLFARRASRSFESHAAAASTAGAAAWLAGFGLFGAVLFQSLTATDPNEIMWWYPQPALVGACWVFALAAVLTLAALPGLAVVGRPSDWPAWRKGAHAIVLLVFLACATTLWRLSFIGFSGW